MRRSVKVTDVASPEMIAEIYQGPKPRQPLISWFTVAGWKERYQRIIGEIKNLYALARCTKDIKGFSMRTFKTDVLELYKKINEHFAAGELTLLRRQTTGQCFGLMKRELKARDKANWGKVSWGLAEEPRLSDLELVQGRMLALDPNNPKTHFVQMTVKFSTKHKFAAYDRKGKLVAGKPEEVFPVQEFWVLERPLANPEGRWLLAARLTLNTDR
mmetsp:Transcript_32105/g.91034  ORF Transcript_32105/g.91034 Transcript_32105/m.91034 type:complete len:215 (+) Transcript_32105:629-1273(+)